MCVCNYFLSIGLFFYFYVEYENLLVTSKTKTKDSCLRQLKIKQIKMESFHWVISCRYVTILIKKRQNLWSETFFSINYQKRKKDVKYTVVAHNAGN